MATQTVLFAVIFLYGYLAAGVMIVAAITELILGVRAEQRLLESVAAPLTAIEQETTA